jgi:hypothetical protein
MNEQVLRDLQEAVSELAERRPRYRTAHNYYNGNHNMVFASEKFRTTFGNRFRSFADNLCPAVIDATADRLHVTGWKGNAETIARATELWKASRMARQAGELHLESLRSGDAYLLVWPDAQGVPRMYAHQASSCYVGYDEELPGVVRYAVKTWMVDDTARINIYYPDRVERYSVETKQGAMPTDLRKLEPYSGDGSGPVVPNPWGVVPVFHFANNGDLGEEGRSELAGVIALQDALNKSHADMLVAMEFHAMPQRYRIGVEAPIDPYTGKPIAPKQGPGVIWDLGEGAQVGQFPQADFRTFLDAINSYRTEIARVSRTPAHLLGLAGDNYPSGEALKTAERPLADKVRDRQTAFGDVWADAMNLALRMSGVNDRVEPEWAPAETISESERLSNAVLKEQVGVPRRQTLLDLGYTEEQVAEMLAELDAQNAALSDQLLQQFNSGTAQ